MQGALDTFYVVVARTEEGYEAINLEKYAVHREALVTLPWGSAVTEVDRNRISGRYDQTYKKIVENYLNPKA